ncbi:hypothetical protein V5799_027510 [Amblyomma americanum]|uniref:Uncharacterized protein n=1 Tax=Amblyomma americanum TaxID=6943 RepID=A0AAQ4DFI4_AMBAM
MDQGIIETTRKLYRKALLQRMLTAYDASKSKAIRLSVIRWSRDVHRAWNERRNGCEGRVIRRSTLRHSAAAGLHPCRRTCVFRLLAAAFFTFFPKLRRAANFRYDFTPRWSFSKWRRRTSEEPQKNGAGQ